MLRNSLTFFNNFSWQSVVRKYSIQFEINYSLQTMKLFRCSCLPAWLAAAHLLPKVAVVEGINSSKPKDGKEGLSVRRSDYDISLREIDTYRVEKNNRFIRTPLSKTLCQSKLQNK
jgi:hypothetical protein